MIVYLIDFINEVCEDKCICVLLLVFIGKFFFVGVDLVWMCCMVDVLCEDNLCDVCKLVLLMEIFNSFLVLMVVKV